MKIKVHNGPLECRWAGYELYEGSRDPRKSDRRPGGRSGARPGGRPGGKPCRKQIGRK